MPDGGRDFILATRVGSRACRSLVEHVSWWIEVFRNSRQVRGAEKNGVSDRGAWIARYRLCEVSVSNRFLCSSYVALKRGGVLVAL